MAERHSTRRFPSDFHVEALRGVRWPGPSRIRRAFVERANYLCARIELRVKLGHEAHWEIAELAAIAATMDELEALWAARAEAKAT